MITRTTITPTRRARGFVGGIVASGIVAAGLAAGGCTSTETHVRVVSRAGALRERAILPSPPERVRIAVGPEALSDAEVAAAEAAVPRRLQAALADVASSLPTSTAATGVARAGRADVLRASASVVLGRDVHRHSAKCRVRVLVDDEIVADAEAEALRTVPVRNRSAWELESVRSAMLANGGRNPLIERADVVAVVDDACVAALRAVTTDARPEDVIVPDPRDPEALPPTSPAIRAAAARARRDRALAALRDTTSGANARAAALVALVDVGVVDDAQVVAPYIRAADARVRRAAELAFSALCAGHALFAPTDADICRRPPADAPPAAGATVAEPAEPPPSAALRPPRPVVGVDDEEDDAEDPAAGPPTPSPSEPSAPPTSPTLPPSG